MPTPPATCNAPVLVDVEFVKLVTVVAPPTNNPPAIPTPPLTCRAPLLVDNTAVVFVIVVFPPTNNPPPIPTPPATCRAPDPVDIVALVPVITTLENVAVPALTGVEASVKLSLPRTVISPPTYNAPPIPAPPATTNAPVNVLLVAVVLASIILPVLNVPNVPATVLVLSSTPLLIHSKYPVALSRPKNALRSCVS